MGAQPSQFQVATEGTIELPPSNNKKTDPILQQIEQRKTTERIFSQEEEYSPQVRRAIKIGFSLLVSITILVLISFLIVISKRANNNNDDDDASSDEDENTSKGKLIFCIVWMLLSSLGLAIVGGLHFFGNTMPSRYRAGMLGGSMLGYANMAFMCALLFVNFQSGEQDSGDGRRYLEQDYNDDDEYQSRRNGIGAFCIFCIIFFLVYASLACMILWKHQSILGEKAGPDTLSSPDEHVMTRSAAMADVLADVWDAVCLLSTIALVTSLVLVPIGFFGNQDERQREESGGMIWNFVLVNVLMIVLVIVLGKVGRDVLGQRKMSSQVAIGAMNGGLFFFAATAFMLAVFYTNLKFGGQEERRREDENRPGSGGFSVVCYFLAGTYGFFAIAVAKHHKSLIRANAKDIYSVEQWREPFVCGEVV